jgi:DNA repair ATPase RecN
MDLSIVERISKTLTELFKELYAQLEKLQTLPAQFEELLTQMEKLLTLPAQFEKLLTQMEKMQTQTEKMQTQMEKSVTTLEKLPTKLDKGMRDMKHDLNVTILDAIHGQKKCPSKTDVDEIESKLNSSPGS